MKIFFRILLAIILIGAIIGGVYYYIGQSKLEKKQLLTYLNDNAVAYHILNSADVAEIIGMVDNQKKSINIVSQLPDSSLLRKIFIQHKTIVSWHLTRQNTLSKVYWVPVSEEFDLIEDTLLHPEKINKLLQLKLGSLKIFIARSNRLLAIGEKGELMDDLSQFDFLIDDSIPSLSQNSVNGSWVKLQEYLRTKSEVFSTLDIDAKSYQLDYYASEGVVFYNLLLDSTAYLCPGMGKAIFNGSLPKSTIAAWQTNFSDNNCILDKHIKPIENQLWELEERYQIKVATIMDAWFDRSFRYLFCDFNGINSPIAAVKLKEDAAPFASGSRFFVDYENLSIGNEMPQKSFTIARVIPEGLAQVVFTGSSKGTSIFVTQYKSHLYFAQKREPLVLLLNELITGNKLNMFDEVIPAHHHFFFRFPEAFNFNEKETFVNENEKRYLVQGKSLIRNNKLIIQGQIVLEK